MRQPPAASGAHRPVKDTSTKGGCATWNRNTGRNPSPARRRGGQIMADESAGFHGIAPQSRSPDRTLGAAKCGVSGPQARRSDYSGWKCRLLLPGACEPRLTLL